METPAASNDTSFKRQETTSASRCCRGSSKIGERRKEREVGAGSSYGDGERGELLPNGAVHEDEDTFIRKEFAHHERGASRINNGSFGSCPASVLASQAQWVQLWLQQPDKFYFGPLEQGLLASRRAIASLIHASDTEEVLLLDNATTAVAMVLQRVAWDFIEGRYQRGDAVLVSNFAYGAVKKAMKAYVGRAGAELIQVKLPFPVCSNEQIVAVFQEALDGARRESRRIRLAVIDHITSMPTMVLPIRELVGLCRRAGVDQVFVDGAHAIGAVEIDVKEIDADYYTSNLHKWLFAPPTVAFFHCKSQHLPALHHPIVSHNYENGLANECAWIGTRDYSAQLAAVNAIQFFDNFEGGIDAIRHRNHTMIVLMGEMLAKAWGTHCGTPPELCSTMIMVGLPPAIPINCTDDALNLRTRIRQEFEVEVPVYFSFDTSSIAADDASVDVPGKTQTGLKAYVRISHQIYNKLEDYVRLRDAVNSLAAESSAQL